MDWDYIFLVNVISAVGTSIIYWTHDNVPWCLAAILVLNNIFFAVSALINDMKRIDREEKIEELEMKLRELIRKLESYK
jgi:hypothetical protein